MQIVWRCFFVFVGLFLWGIFRVRLLCAVVLAFPVVVDADSKVYLMTVGSGESLETLWGHNALFLDDRESGRRLLYSAGNFFWTETVIPDLLVNDLKFWVALQSYDVARDTYSRQDRSIFLQELSLTGAEKKLLMDLINESLLPGNRVYRYHHFRNNCSSKIRDLLNTVLNGQLEYQSSRYTQSSLRDYVFEGLQANMLLLFSADFVLNASVDAPLTRYDEMVFPLKFMEHLNTVYVIRGDQKDMLVSQNLQVYARRVQNASHLVNGGILLLCGILLCCLRYPRVTFARVNFHRWRIAGALSVFGGFFFL